MSYKALYRKWRPKSFNDIVEQNHITTTLKKSVMANRVAHAYLFSGTRGTGKTSMALILARAINCLNPKNGNPCNKCKICEGILNHTIFDVIEIDAASNNSVDNIRTIRDEIMYTPSVSKYKVYIIDEVHMLSIGAFNALLKTLEEPPSHVIFILATTEPHKLPATILSRCQHYNFHRISIDGICSMLDRIIDDSDFVLEKKASKMIARISDGALRNAINLLDQCISLDIKEITVKEVLECAGIPNDLAMEKLALSIFNKNISKVLEIVNKVLMQGKSSSQLLQSLIYYFRNLLVCKSIENAEDYIESTSEDIIRMKSNINSISTDLITYIIKELSKADTNIKKISQPKTYLEIVLINICTLNASDIKELSILERISIIERKVNNINNRVEVKTTTSPSITKKPLEVLPKKVASNSNIKQFDWENVIKHLTDLNYVDIFPYLLSSTAYIKNNVVTICITSEFNMNMINNSNSINSIIEAIMKTTGNSYKINIIVSTSEEQTEAQDSFEKNLNSISDDLGVKVEFKD